MSVISTLAVRLTAITGDFDKAMSDASKKIDQISKSAGKIAKESGVAFAGMVGAIALVTHESSEALKGQRQLEGAFKSAGNSLDMSRFEKFAEVMQSNSTVSDDAVIHMGTLMASFGRTQGQIESLIPGIIDLSAVTGQASDSIAEKLSIAIESGDANLKKMGITMGETEKAAFKMGSEAQRTGMLVAKLGAFQGAAAAEASTAEGRFMQMKNALAEVAKEAGKILDAPLAAIFSRIRDAAMGAAQAFANLSPATKEWIGYIVIGVTAVTYFVASVAGFIALAAPIKAAIVAIASVGAALIPLLPVIAAIAAGVALVIFTLGYMAKFGPAAWNDIKVIGTAVAEAVTKAWGYACEKIGQAWGWVKDFVTSIFESIITWIKDHVPGAAAVLDKIGDVAKSAADSAGSAMGSVWDAMTDKASEAADAIPKAIGGAWDWIKKDTKAAVKVMMEEFGMGIDVIESMFAKLGLKMPSMEKAAVAGASAGRGGGGSVWANYGDGAKYGPELPEYDKYMREAVRNVKQYAEEAILSAASSALAEYEQQQVQELNNLSQEYQKAADATSNMAEKATLAAKAHDAAAKAAQIQSMPHATDIFSGAAQGAAQGTAILPGIGTVLGAVFGALMAILSKIQAFGKLISLFDNSISGIMRLLTPIIEILASIAGALMRVAESTISEWVDKLASFLETFAQDIQGLCEIFEKIGTAVTGFINDYLKKFLNTISFGQFDGGGGGGGHAGGDLLGIGKSLQDMCANANAAANAAKEWADIQNTVKQNAQSAAANIADLAMKDALAAGKTANQAAGAYADTLSKYSSAYTSIWQKAYDATHNEAAATAIANEKLSEMAGALDDASKAANSLTDSLSNVPTGYLMTLAEFNAARSAGGYSSPISGQSAGGGVSIQGNVNISVNGAGDPKSVAQAVRDQLSWESFRTTGQSVRNTPSAGVPRT